MNVRVACVARNTIGGVKSVLDRRQPRFPHGHLAQNRARKIPIEKKEPLSNESGSIIRFDYGLIHNEVFSIR